MIEFLTGLIQDLPGLLLKLITLIGGAGAAVAGLQPTRLDRFDLMTSTVRSRSASVCL